MEASNASDDISPYRDNVPLDTVSRRLGSATVLAGDTESRFSSFAELGKKKRPKRSIAGDKQATVKKKVVEAALSVLGHTPGLAHALLALGAEFLDLVPVPGLSAAARTLLKIWDAVEEVDLNVNGCLRLAERCADNLRTIRDEVIRINVALEDTLKIPIQKLEESFNFVLEFVLTQSMTPWLKRYPRRNDIPSEIADCDARLRDALAVFGVSVQFRILQQLGTPMIAQNTSRQLLGAETIKGDTQVEAQATSDVTVNAQLECIQVAQNTADTAEDTSALRALLETALSKRTDAAIIEVFQVARDEMPDAIKILQRVLQGLDGREPTTNSEYLVEDAQTEQYRRAEGDNPWLASKATLGVERHGATSPLSPQAERSMSDFQNMHSLDFQFIVMGITCMRRLTNGEERAIPDWIITEYELIFEKKIGYGFFSDVYRGRWRNELVAIKVLAPSTPRNLFVREMGIWKTLNHPNVLRLYGASSACGPSPWLFVSPCLQHGSLVDYLRHVEQNVRPPGLGVGARANDLSGTITPRANSPAFRASTLPASPRYITNKSPRQGGAMRHPLLSMAHPPRIRPRICLPGFFPNDLSSELFAPVEREWDLFRFMHEIVEGMSYLHSMGVLHGDLKASNVLVGDAHQCVITDFGQSEMKNEAFRTTGIPLSRGTLRWQAPEFMAGKTELTQPVDVWAFSITCVEILTMGRLPWLNQDDAAVRHFVLHDDTRPPIPPLSRFNIPSLRTLLRKCWDTQPKNRPPFKSIADELKRIRKSVGESPDASPFSLPQEVELPPAASPSPDMRPKDLPAFLAGGDGRTLSADVLEGALMGPDPLKQPVDDGYESPLPPLDGIPLAKNERRYRLLLTHNFHPSLTLPLWDPSPVEVGAVGYLLKPEGRFITLFNALRPREGTPHPQIGNLSSIKDYGPVVLGEQQLSTRTVTQRAMDAIIGSITVRNSTSESIARRSSFPLKVGLKSAHLYTEMANYRYMESLDAPKLWFRHNADVIMQIYGTEHRIAREELFLIIGTLNTPAWALMVSHRHPEGHAHFNVYSNPRSGEPWGTFTTDNEVERGLSGPLYEGEEMNDPPRVNLSKVSKHGLTTWDSVLLARLRFKLDSPSPTST